MNEQPNLNAEVSEKYRKVAEKYNLKGKRLERYNVLVAELRKISGDKTIRQLKAEEKFDEIVAYGGVIKKLKELIGLDTEIIFEFELNEGEEVQSAYICDTQTFTVIEAGEAEKKYRILDENGFSVADEYANVRTCVELGNIVYFAVDKLDNASVIVGRNGDILSHEYKFLNGPKIIGGDLFYCGKKDDDSLCFFNRKGTFIEPEDYYFQRHHEINGKIYYHLIDKDNKKSKIVDEEGNSADNDYVEVSRPTRIGDSLFMRCKDESGKEFVIDQDGVIIGDKYDHVGGLVNVGGQSSFIVTPSGTLNYVVVFNNGNNMTQAFLYVDNITDVKGMLLFSITKDNNKLTSVVVDSGGNEMSKEYEYIHGIIDSDKGFFLYVGNKLGDSMIMNEDEEQVGENYKMIYGSVNAGGKLYFQVKKLNGYEAIIREDGTVLADDLQDVNDFAVVDGELFVEAMLTSGSRVIINKDGEHVGGEFDELMFPDVIVGKIFFSGKKDDGLDRLYDEDGRPITGEFNDIFDVKEIDGEVFVLGVRAGKVVKERFTFGDKRTKKNEE